jgi:hypothetical protein
MFVDILLDERIAEDEKIPKVISEPVIPEVFKIALKPLWRKLAQKTFEEMFSDAMDLSLQAIACPNPEISSEIIRQRSNRVNQFATEHAYLLNEENKRKFGKQLAKSFARIDEYPFINIPTDISQSPTQALLSIS